MFRLARAATAASRVLLLARVMPTRAFAAAPSSAGFVQVRPHLSASFFLSPLPFPSSHTITSD